MPEAHRADTEGASRAEPVVADLGNVPDGPDGDSLTVHDSLHRQVCRQASETLSCPRTQNEAPEDASDSHLVTWLPGERENPQNWSLASRWLITLRCSIMTINVTFASSAPSSATIAISERFQSSLEISTLITSLFLCGYMTGPIIWGPLSELIGRRPVFLGTLGVFAVLQLAEALNTNLATILVIRFLSGIFAVAPMTNCGGVIADIWDPVHRPQAMTIFTAATFIGPVLGPIMASFVVKSHLGFRWVFWLMMVFSAGCWVMAFFLLPETYSPVLLARRAKQLRAQTGNSMFYAAHERADFSLKGILHRTVLRPFEMFASEPILQLVIVYTSIVYGLLYGLFEAFPIIWGIRGFAPWKISLMFIGVGIGTTLGAILNLFLLRPMSKQVPKWHGHPPCEMNLYGAMAAGPFLIIGVFWLGWTGAYAQVPWYVPALSTIFVGMSFTLVFISFLSYLVDVYLMYAASALAANTICRSMVGAAFPLFTRQMFTQLGIQWAATLIGGVAILLSPSPFIFYKYGSRLRVGSKFAPALDVKMRSRIEAEQAEARAAQSKGTLSVGEKCEENLQSIQHAPSFHQPRPSTALDVRIESKRNETRLPIRAEIV